MLGIDFLSKKKHLLCFIYTYRWQVSKISASIKNTLSIVYLNLYNCILHLNNLIRHYSEPDFEDYSLYF